LAILGLALLVLNLGYGFQGTGLPLGDHQFSSQMLSAARSAGTSGVTGNRFRETWMGRIPLPFPAAYLIGMDLQKRDFECGMWSYLAGEHRLGGWWYFYLYALAVKVPLGTWLLLSLATVVWIRQGCSSALNAWHLLLTPLCILILVSVHDSISRYLRYLLPAFGYVFIWISRVGCFWDVSTCSEHGLARGKTVWRWATVLSLAGSVTSSLVVFPHNLSYFNLLAGGPRNGHAHLIDASIDWGQDLKLLRCWLKQHPWAQPLYLDVYSALDPRWLGIAYQRIPTADTENRSAPSTADREQSRPVPTHGDPNRRRGSIGSRPAGWYAVSVHRLHDRSGRFDDLRQCEPFCRIGFSIYIYRVAGDAQSRLRWNGSNSASSKPSFGESEQ